MKPGDVHKIIGKYMLADGDSIVLDLKRSEGAYMYDALENRKLIDFCTFFGSMPISHNHPKMHETEFLEELERVAMTKPSNSDFYTVEMAKFVDTFGRLAMPGYMKNLFFVSGGALAVENALKSAFDWKVRKNFEHIKNAENFMAAGIPEGLGTRIIHFREAFHGRSGYTLSLTNTADPRKHKYFPKFDWPRVTNPKLSFPVTEKVLREVKRQEEIAIAEIMSAVNQFGGDIAALIIEPIQAEGGDNHFRPEFFKELRRLADEHEFLFIVDEVQSGMGITGDMWAIDKLGVEPDMIAFGKKAQICGFMSNARVEEVHKNVFEESSRINSTFGGNLVDMVRSRRYIEIIVEDNLLENTRIMGERLAEGLQSIAAESKGVISNVRGRGLMQAVDLPSRAIRNTMLQDLKKNGLITLACGPKSIRFRGMLDTPAEVVDEALEVFARCVPPK